MCARSVLYVTVFCSKGPDYLRNLWVYWRFWMKCIESSVCSQIAHPMGFFTSLTVICKSNSTLTSCKMYSSSHQQVLWVPNLLSKNCLQWSILILDPFKHKTQASPTRTSPSNSFLDYRNENKQDGQERRRRIRRNSPIHFPQTTSRQTPIALQNKPINYENESSFLYKATHIPVTNPRNFGICITWKFPILNETCKKISRIHNK